MPAAVSVIGFRRDAGRFVSASLTLIFGFLVLTIWLAPAKGQEFRASITGEIADATGAKIPNATISVVNVDTKVTASTKSNGEGDYSLLFLLPGTYTVTATATTFETKVYSGVRLDSAQQLGLNISLQPSSVAERVEVISGAVDLDTVSATSGGVIDQAKVENIPTAGLMVYDDVVLSQGIHTSDPKNLFNLTPRNSGNKYSASGAQKDENAYFVNGAPVSHSGDWFITPNQASVQQVQASAMPYDAQYGRTGGGAFNVNLKNGTNAYHGMIYDYFGNQALNATGWANGLTGARKSVNIRNVWGAQSSGPIRKNKTFYFVSYEQFLQHLPGQHKDTVPTAAELQGDFSGTPYTIYDPTSTYCSQVNSKTGGCTTYARKPFNGNIIPHQYISPIGQAILALYPKPMTSALVDNYTVAGPTMYGYRQHIGRIDNSFSEKTSAYVIFLYEHDNAVTPGNAFKGVAWNGTKPVGTFYSGILDVTHIFSPSRVMDLKASYGRSTTNTEAGDMWSQGFDASKLGLSMPTIGTTSRQLAPAFTVKGATALGGNTSNGSADVIADFSGSLTQVIGRHNLHYGAEFEDIQTAPTGVLGNPNGSFTFDSVYTQGNPNKAATGQGHAFASILLGVPSSGNVSWITPTFVTMHYYGLFVQDNYKLLPNLSLNLGLRWDVNAPPRDRHNRINAGFCLTCTNPLTSQVNFATAPDLNGGPLRGGLQFAGVDGMPATPFKAQWNEWQPRLGFSWGVNSDTVVRGGYGLYFPWAPLDVDTAGFSQTTSFVATLDGGLTHSPYFQSGTPYPNGAIAPSGASLGLATNAGNNIAFNNPNRRLRLTQHWSIGVQRRIPLGMLLDVQYVGTQVQHIPVNTPLNVIPTSLQQQCAADNSICNAAVPNSFHGILSPSSTLGALASLQKWQLMRPYPLFNNVTENRMPIGSSDYNSLDVRVERRVKNLNFVFNYSYSNWTEKVGYLNSGNFLSSSLDKELDPADRRHVLVTNFIYPIPGLKVGGSLLGYVTKGWIFGSTVQWSTGTPLALPNANFNWGTPGCTSYAPAGGQTRAHWFNNDLSCWHQLGTWEAQTTPDSVGFIRNPYYVQWLPGINRTFGLHREGTYAQFRAEGLNGANHPVFGAPSTAIGTPPSYSPTTSWTGFGTLPNAQYNQARQIFLSLKIVF